MRRTLRGMLVAPWSPDPPFTVDRAVMTMRWETLTFLHWAYDPAVIQARLPDGLTVHTYDGQAWISLVPFVMRVGLPRLGLIPGLRRFPETNVRTYVVAADGTEGIHFFSLDASRLAAVVGGRAGYRLRYIWSAMQVRRGPTDDVITYTCRRRHEPRGASSRIMIRVGAPYEPGELSDLDHWLSARYRLYSRMFGSSLGARAHHLAWTLRRATALEWDTSLIVADGLPAPVGPPIVQFSDGVAVRISRPYRIRRPQHGARRNGISRGRPSATADRPPLGDADGG